MSIFRLRVRNPRRDMEAAPGHIRRLLAMLDDLTAEIETETRGINARYRRVVDDAAFALQALENEGAGSLASKVDELSCTMAWCSERAETLRYELALLRELQQMASAFVRERLS